MSARILEQCTDFDGSGLTPLGCAVDVIADGEQQTGDTICLEVAAVLLDAGADPDQQSQRGTSARSLAIKYRHDRLLKLFDRYAQHEQYRARRPS